jgi:hypothetical protein
MATFAYLSMVRNHNILYHSPIVLLMLVSGYSFNKHYIMESNLVLCISFLITILLKTILFTFKYGVKIKQEFILLD